jgi:hypothetical protein
MSNKPKPDDPATNSPENIPRRFAQDLPGASGGSRQRWRSMINGGSPEQPDKDGTARHDPTVDLPIKPNSLKPDKSYVD